MPANSPAANDGCAESATVSPAAQRILRLLVGQPPQSMHALIKATGVTRTAITEQLSDLLAAGHVRRTVDRIGRGRPRHLYTVSDEGLRQLFRNNQRLVAVALMRAMFEIAGREVASQVLDQVSKDLAAHYLARMQPADDPASRARQLVDLLRAEGIVVDFEAHDGQWQIRERTCPFVDLADDSRAICVVERAMMGQVLGAPIHSTTCRLDGCAGCTFELTAPPAANAPDPGPPINRPSTN